VEDLRVGDTREGVEVVGVVEAVEGGHLEDPLGDHLEEEEAKLRPLHPNRVED
jgi:hypothetical protein